MCCHARRFARWHALAFILLAGLPSSLLAEEPVPLPPVQPAAEATVAAPLTPTAQEPVQHDGAGLNGVYAGKTTRAELYAAWGKPEKIEKIAGGARETFQVEPFGTVRVKVAEEVVESLTIRCEQPVAADEIAARLPLNGVEPVELFDEAGELLGQAYPERGMLFGFVPGGEGKQVFQIVIEPIDAETFLARAELRMANRYADCLADLTQVMQLTPDSARAYWLHAELMLRVGDLLQATKSAHKAVALEAEQPEYRLTLARAMAASGDFPPAIEITSKLAQDDKTAPLVAAKAQCQWGDCLAAAPERDFGEAIKHHTEAIKQAEPLATSKKAAVRRAATRLLVEASLGVAHDVGWGRWQNKPKVAMKWIDRGASYADQLVDGEPGTAETRLRLNEQALSALAGIADPPDAANYVNATIELAQKALDESSDPHFQASVSWQLALALADATEIEYLSNHPDRALELGSLAAQHFDRGVTAGKQCPTHDYLRGRLCCRVGAIYSVNRNDHQHALPWFNAAVPLLESPAPPCAAVDVGRQGESFVRMAVSYWELNNRTEALRLTQQGVKLMERAAADGQLARAALAIPYGNLASMHQQLGNAKAAKENADLAARAERSAQQ